MFVGLILAEALVAFCALAFEVMAARLVAPYAGMSTDTWTAIIAAFLLALALGNRIGGALAASEDRVGMLRNASLASAAGGIAVAATPFLISTWDALALAPAPSTLWRIVLFAGVPCIPAGLLFGIATPLLMMSVLAEDREQGTRAGMMYAAGAAGSVLGVLAALWVLLDSLGVQASLLLVGMLALVNAVLIVGLSRAPRRVVAA